MYEFEAKCIRSAIKGPGTNENLLIQLLCSKEAYEIERLKREYLKCLKLISRIFFI
jgi:hypothetical protein